MWPTWCARKHTTDATPYSHIRCHALRKICQCVAPLWILPYFIFNYMVQTLVSDLLQCGRRTYIYQHSWFISLGFSISPKAIPESLKQYSHSQNDLIRRMPRGTIQYPINQWRDSREELRSHGCSMWLLDLRDFQTCFRGERLHLTTFTWHGFVSDKYFR